MIIERSGITSTEAETTTTTTKATTTTQNGVTTQWYSWKEHVDYNPNCMDDKCTGWYGAVKMCESKGFFILR